MLENLKRQPLSISIAADHFVFRFYKSGVVDHACGLDLDHDVAIVGADTDTSTTPPTKYWIVRNSWGPTWGIDGYMHI